MPRLRRILAFLLLGAVMNVLVAWGCAKWGDRRVHTPVDPMDRTLEAKSINVVPRWAIEWIDQAQAKERFGQDWPTGVQLRQIDFPGCRRVMCRRWYTTPWHIYHLEQVSVSLGWPARSLRYYERSIHDHEYFPESRVWRLPGWHGGVPFADPIEKQLEQWWVPDWQRVVKPVYPLTPIALPFTLNTLFYAALLYLPFAAFSTLRRRRRIRRNLRLSCGYSLAGAVPTKNTIICPECGKSSN